MKKSVLVGASAVLSLAAAGSAAAAPITVNVRVEGRTATLLERSVTFEPRTFHFTNDATEHQCDGTVAAAGGTATAPTQTSNTALLTATEAQGLSLLGTWNAQYQNPTYTSIAGEDATYDPATFSYFGEYHNGSFSMTGGCGELLNNGDDVLFAWGNGSEIITKLTGPATATPGATVAVKLVDEATGNPVAGAAIGGTTTGADGVAQVTLADRGPQTLKATKAGTFRSNALPTCVTDGADGFCGTTKPGAPAPSAPTTPATAPSTSTPALPAKTSGKITGVTEQQHLKKGPRSLGGTVTVGTPGLKDVSIRLSRTVGRRCYSYDAKHERFKRMKRCGAARAPYFSVGAKADWSYLFPRALAKGRYVLDVKVTDNNGAADGPLQRGRNRVVFYVK